MMRLTICALGLIALLPLHSPALAVTAKEKQATCKFGADHQKLTGAKRKQFLAKCMTPEKGTKPVKRANKPQPT